MLQTTQQTHLPVLEDLSRVKCCTSSSQIVSHQLLLESDKQSNTLWSQMRTWAFGGKNQKYFFKNGKIFSYFSSPAFFRSTCYPSTGKQMEKRSQQGLENKFPFLHICLQLALSALHLSINSVILQRAEM